MATVLINLFSSANCLKDSQLLIITVTARHTCKSLVVHWPENQVSTNQRYPEMDISHRIIHITAIHFREPVVNTGKHSEE